jgi:hypothetical protein
LGTRVVAFAVPADVSIGPAAEREHNGGVLASVDRRADGGDEAVFAKTTEPFLRYRADGRMRPPVDSVSSVMSW